MDTEARIAKLESIITKLERKLKPTNEVAPILAKILPLIVKNLPLILKLMPQLTELLKTDQINDNSEKIKKIEDFTKLGEEIIDMLSNFGK